MRGVDSDLGEEGDDWEPDDQWLTDYTFVPSWDRGPSASPTDAGADTSKSAKQPSKVRAPQAPVFLVAGGGALLALVPLILMSMQIPAVQAATTVTSLEQMTEVL